MAFKDLFRAFGATLGLGALLGACGLVTGQEAVPVPPPQRGLIEAGEPQFPKKYSTLDAGRDAYERAERKRRENINRQVQTIDDIAWYQAWPGSYRWPPSLASIYADPYRYAPGPGGLARRAISRAFRAPLPWSYGPVFEPWPFVPGDIWGYPYVDRVEQPLGHKTIQTGPNSYIYRPFYARDLAAQEVPSERPAPAEAPRAEEVPPPPPENIPAPAAEPGPRVF
jgi:hypothetical protein